MEQALYHFQHGYYAKPRKRIGREGDFYTNVSVGKTFGQVLATQILEMWNALGRPQNFRIVEQGAEDGQLAADILSALEDPQGSAVELAYTIIEPIAANRAEQQSRLENRFRNPIQWEIALANLQPVHGVFISNELLDALPVHLLEYRENRWSELHVTWSGKDFEFIARPIRSSEVLDATARLPVPLRSPYRTELNLCAPQWINEIGSRLERGFVLVIDYGHPRHQYYSAGRTEGTLACYSRHRRTFNPLQDPGVLDITAHVDFTSLAESAERANLRVAGYADQHHFIIGATQSYLKQIEQEIALYGPNHSYDQFLRQLKTLMHPGNMGMSFKYLLLSRGVEFPVLTGFKYAREPRRALGMS
jgi:SAM-dependent MidA family methyltransferase